MPRPFLRSQDEIAHMRDQVRFEGFTYAHAGSNFGYSRTSAFNAIGSYEERNGLDARTREERFGGKPIAAADAPCDMHPGEEETQTPQDSTKLGVA